MFALPSNNGHCLVQRRSAKGIFCLTLRSKSGGYEARSPSFHVSATRQLKVAKRIQGHQLCLVTGRRGAIDPMPDTKADQLARPFRAHERSTRAIKPGMT